MTEYGRNVIVLVDGCDVVSVAGLPSEDALESVIFARKRCRPCLLFRKDRSGRCELLNQCSSGNCSHVPSLICFEEMNCQGFWELNIKLEESISNANIQGGETV